MWRLRQRSRGEKGGTRLRFQTKKVSAVTTVLALVLGVTAVLVTALPASASTITSFTPTCGATGVTVTINGSGFTGMTDVLFNGTSSSGEVFVSDAQVTATVPAGATAGTIVVETPAADTASTANFIPAAAGVPTITSFAPTTGSVGSSVVITGTNFGCTSSVVFNTTAATTYVVNSATQITATVPVGATTGPLHVTTTGGGPANSAANFTVVAGPAITSFTPTSGPVGTSVTITGTNLTGVTAVKFNGVTATFTTSTATSVTATVPTGATTGKITVTTPGGTATSATDFTVTGAAHKRSLTLRLQKHLLATGTLTAKDGFLACEGSQPVKIQRLKNGNWKTLATIQTQVNGNYRTHIGDKEGKFRAKAPKQTLASGEVCGAATSKTREHSH